MSRIASAQAYPSRRTYHRRLSPGGSVDIVARLIGQWLSEAPQPAFIVENRPGAAATLATGSGRESAARWLYTSADLFANFINATLYEKASLSISCETLRRSDPCADTERHGDKSIGGAGQDCSRVCRLRQGQSWAKPTWARPGAEPDPCFRRNVQDETGIEMVHVPYRGSAPLVTACSGGQVQVAFDNLPSSIEQIRAGKLRALA